MRVKIAEKRLFSGLALLAVSILLLLNATPVNAPVRLSEKGIAGVLIAVVLFLLSIRLIGKSKVNI